MSEKILIKYCSPTLAGLKAGSMVSLSFQSWKDFFTALLVLKATLEESNIKVSILSVTFYPTESIKSDTTKCYSGRCLIYIYRPSKLKEILSHKETLQFLQRFGYTDNDVNNCICKLRRNLKNGKNFPHEIGIFLGYPLNDVKGFYENAGKNYTLCRQWKSYNPSLEAANKLFDKMSKCTRVYTEMLELGVPLKRLAVKI